MRADAILARLDPEQAAAASAAPGPLLIVAGAGTGKTTALIARIAHHTAAGQWDPAKTLAVTHSSKAAGQLRSRLLAYNVAGLPSVTARTFHAAALRMLRHFWDQTPAGSSGVGFDLLDSPYAAIRLAMRRAGRRDPATTLVFDVASEIGWAKASLVSAKDYPRAAAKAGREVAGVPITEMAALYGGYGKELERAGKLDFTDLLIVLAELIAANGDVAEAIRSRYDHLLVDEYQDTDPAQAKLLDALLGGRDDITAVGDPRQSIYRFRGADTSVLSGFAARHPGAMVVNLVRDYRSTSQIVAVANRLMATPAADALVGMAGDGPPVGVTAVADEDSEAAFVAARVAAALSDGVPPSEVAVLYRFNAQSASFEQALATRGIAYTVADTERFFDRPEVVSVVAATTRMMHEQGLDGLTGNEMDDDFVSGVALLRAAAESVGFDADTPPAGAGAARDRWEGIAALLALVEAIPRIDFITVPELVAELARRRAEVHGARTQTVTLATLHKAKGLEWDVVFLPRLVEGSLPSAYATSEEEVAEERRLFYVGVTRARQRVVCSYARMRGSGKRQWPATESRFLADAGLVTAARVATGPARPRPTSATASAAGCTTCGVALDSPGAKSLRACAAHLQPVDAALFAALRSWRTGVAKEARKPAFTVLTDGTLLNLVASRPKDRAGLTATHGIGATKATNYGDALLDLISAR